MLPSGQQLGERAQDLVPHARLDYDLGEVVAGQQVELGWWWR
jgi:hypothetical protein